MEERIELRGGGTLTVRREENRVRMEAARQRDDRGLYKVWLLGQRGGRLLLGTLAPEGETLGLRRTLSVGELERAGCWPVAGGETVLAFAFSGGERWYREGHPEGLLADPVLCRQIKGAMLCRRAGDGFLLAAPFRTDSPVALEGLFCLARVEKLDGRPHLIWAFDGGGRPKIPYKSQSDGAD